MKRCFALILALLVAFTGCTSASAHSSDVCSTSEQTSEQADDFPEVESEFILDFYRKEVESRMGLESFCSDEEKEVLKKEGFWVSDNYIAGSTSNYLQDYLYCPVVCEVDGKTIILYMTQEGSLRGIDKVHLSYKEMWAMDTELKIVYSDWRKTITYSSNGLEAYKFGKRVALYPEKGIWVGNSDRLGFIFRDGSDVKAITWNEFSDSFEETIVAHGVKEVLFANYQAGVDTGGMPLCLMEDGTIKACYSPDYIVEPTCEGGYH